MGSVNETQFFKCTFFPALFELFAAAMLRNITVNKCVYTAITTQTSLKFQI